MLQNRIESTNGRTHVTSSLTDSFKKSGIKHGPQWLDRISQPVPDQDAIAFVGADGTLETWQRIKVVRTAADSPHKGKNAEKDVSRGYTYLAPSGAGDRIFKPQLILEAIEAIAQVWGVNLDLNRPWSQLTPNSNIPICITEGLKKTLALLESGYPTVSLYGVRCGIDKDSGEIKPNLAELIPPGKTVILVFDEDEKQSTRIMVESQIKKWARAIASMGEERKLKVARWDNSLGKGIDDVLFNNGIERLRLIIGGSEPIETKPAPKKDSGEFVRNAGQVIFDNLFKRDPWICWNGRLYQYNGDYYEFRSDECALHLIQDFANSYVISKGGCLTTPLAEGRHISEGLRFAKTQLYIDPEQINPAGYINLSNCVLHITWEGSKPSWKELPKTGDIKFIYPGTVSYDPNADPQHCDRLLSALDPGPREILLRVLAAGFDLPKVRALRGRAVRALFMWGAGSNGKDAIRETVAPILGYGMSSIPLSSFAQYDAGRKFPLAGLVHSRLNWSSENGDVDIDGLQSLKAAQTGDPLQCEYKGKDEVQFTPNTVFLFNTNQPPRMTGSLNSSSTRYAVIQFSKTFKDNPSGPGEIKADPRFKNDPKFITEQVAPALLNYLLAALTRLAAEGIDYSSLDQTLREVRSRTNHLLEFFDDIGMGYVDGNKVDLDEIWKLLCEHYTDSGLLARDSNGREIYAEAYGTDRPIKSKKVLSTKIQQAYPCCKKYTERTKNRQITYFVGLGFGVPSVPTLEPLHVVGTPPENLPQSGLQKTGVPSVPSEPINQTTRGENIYQNNNNGIKKEDFIDKVQVVGTLGTLGTPNNQNPPPVQVTDGVPTKYNGSNVGTLGTFSPDGPLNTGIRFDPVTERYQIVGTNYTDGSIEALLVHYPRLCPVRLSCCFGDQEITFTDMYTPNNLLLSMRLWFDAAIKKHRWGERNQTTDNHGYQ